MPRFSQGELLDRLAHLVKTDLQDQFKGSYEIGPVAADLRHDFIYESPYFRILVGYRGQDRRPDPAITVGIPYRLRRELDELGISCLFTSLVPECEWDHTAEVMHLERR